MRIYVASSWKNENEVMALTTFLRSSGHEVDCFCDNSNGRYIFSWQEIVKDKDFINAIDFLKDKRSQKAFAEDKKWLDWSECVIMVYPCGNSSHLEAGYAKGQGKILYLFGKFPKGHFDVMYGFADGIFQDEDLDKLLAKLSEDK